MGRASLGGHKGEGGGQWAVGQWVCGCYAPGWSLAVPRSRSPSTRTGAAAAAPAAAAPAAAVAAGGAAQGAGDWQRVPAGTRTAGTAASPKSAGCTTRAPASEPRAGGWAGGGGPGAARSPPLRRAPHSGSAPAQTRCGQGLLLGCPRCFPLSQTSAKGLPQPPPRGALCHRPCPEQPQRAAPQCLQCPGWGA